MQSAAVQGGSLPPGDTGTTDIEWRTRSPSPRGVSRPERAGEEIMSRLPLSLALVCAAIPGLVFFTVAPSGEKTPAGERKETRIANRPKVPGKLRLNLRERREEPKPPGQVKVALRSVDWDVAETAIIVCDM